MDQVAVPYRNTSAEAVAYGPFCMIDTDQISTSVNQPGTVIRNEDVFIDKERERVTLADAVGHLLSAVLLLQTGRGAAEVSALDVSGSANRVAGLSTRGMLERVLQRLRAKGGCSGVYLIDQPGVGQRRRPCRRGFQPADDARRVAWPVLDVARVDGLLAAIGICPLAATS